MAVVVCVERPHESTAQSQNPVSIIDARVGREFVIISNEAAAAVASYQVGYQCDRIVIALPSLLVDEGFNVRSIVFRKNRIVAVTVGSFGIVGTGLEKLADIGVVIAVERCAHVQLLGRHVFKKQLGRLLITGTGLTFLRLRIVLVPKDRGIKLANAGPWSSTVVDHQIEKIGGDF